MKTISLPVYAIVTAIAFAPLTAHAGLWGQVKKAGGWLRDAIEEVGGEEEVEEEPPAKKTEKPKKPDKPAKPSRKPAMDDVDTPRGGPPGEGLSNGAGVRGGGSGGADSAYVARIEAQIARQQEILAEYKAAWGEAKGSAKETWTQRVQAKEQEIQNLKTNLGQ